jgi:hypothetical protein
LVPTPPPPVAAPPTPPPTPPQAPPADEAKAKERAERDRLREALTDALILRDLGAITKVRGEIKKAATHQGLFHAADLAVKLITTLEYRYKDAGGTNLSTASLDEVFSTILDNAFRKKKTGRVERELRAAITMVAALEKKDVPQPLYLDDETSIISKDLHKALELLERPYPGSIPIPRDAPPRDGPPPDGAPDRRPPPR